MTRAPRSSADAFYKPRRFYKAAAVEAHDGGFGVALDGRVAKTPAGGRLILPSPALADLLTAEWRAQGDTIEIASMPATRLAFTALDGGEAAREKLADEVARYASSDLLCYFAEGPETLLAEQLARWGPVLDWAEAELGLRLVRATGVVHRPQADETVSRARGLAIELDTLALTGLAFATALFGSAVLAFALHRARLSGKEAFQLSRLDETYQERQWGVDAEAAARTAKLQHDAEMLERWFAALRSGTP